MSKRGNHKSNDLLESVSPGIKSPLTVDGECDFGRVAVDGVGQLTRELSVVLFLQRVDGDGAAVLGEGHSGVGRQSFTVLEPRRRLHRAFGHRAAQVRRAVPREKDAGRGGHFDSGDRLWKREERQL